MSRMNWSWIKRGVLVLSLGLSGPSTSSSGENFNVEAEMLSLFVQHYSTGVVEEFMARVDRYNENRENIDFFVEQFQSEHDRRFVRLYLEEIKLTGLRPFSYVNGRVRLTYPEYVIELGPVEALEGKVIIDGKHYALNTNGGARSQLVAIKQVLEEHAKAKETTVGKVQRFFSWVSPVSTSYASLGDPTRQHYGLDLDLKQSPATRSRVDEVAGALLLTSNYLNFHHNATGEKLRENLRQFAQLIHDKRYSCRRDLREMTAQNGQYTEGERPGNNPRAYTDTYPLVLKLEEFARSGSFHALDQMRRALDSHLYAAYPPHEHPRFCRNTFERAFSANEEAEMERVCADLDDLRECTSEFMSQGRIYQDRYNDWFIREHPEHGRQPAGATAASSSR